jgi:hypothetical protein
MKTLLFIQKMIFLWVQEFDVLKSNVSQQAFGKIANFVVNSRLFLARNFIFDRK